MPHNVGVLFGRGGIDKGSNKSEKDLVSLFLASLMGNAWKSKKLGEIVHSK